MFSSARTSPASLLVAILMMTGLSACAHRSDSTQTTKVESPGESPVNRAAREADAAYFVEIEFQRGSDKLSESSRSAISSLLSRAKAEGKIDDVKVLSWADQEYPAKGGKKLSADQRRLASSRNRNITSLVKESSDGVSVDAHNMAERPGAIASWLNTPDARFKRSLVAAGLPTTADEVSASGRASHSVVLVRIQ